MKIALVIGTRPEIIKVAPIIREIERRKIDYFIIHTNQHYSKEMDKLIFDNLNIIEAKYNLQVGSGNHGEQTGKMLGKIEKVFFKEKPDIVLVHGDTNTTLAGALAAKKMQIKVGHIEAGLRSFDNTMPEETNRIIVDHISDYLFAPTENSANNLKKEGINNKKIKVVGNTIVDAILQHKKLAEKSNILNDLGLEEQKYIILTCHRPSNTDNINNLKNIISGVSDIGKIFKLNIVFTIHPRTKIKINEHKINIPDNIITTAPLGYLDMIKLMNKSKIIYTDSGGIQEESCILNIPTITLRNNTERPESLETGGNILVGSDREKIIKTTDKMINGKFNWKIKPFGKGNTSVKILDILIKNG